MNTSLLYSYWYYAISLYICIDAIFLFVYVIITDTPPSVPGKTNSLAFIDKDLLVALKMFNFIIL